ncbi:MAG: hypothetical protein JWQ40_4653 [Segetibacter sp.]|nr:hypothetical protein [Segetibacter sp.]
MGINLQREPKLTLTFNHLHNFCFTWYSAANSYRKNEQVFGLCKFNNSATNDLRLPSFSLKEKLFLSCNYLALARQVKRKLTSVICGKKSPKTPAFQVQTGTFQYSKLSLGGFVIALYSNYKHFFPHRCKNIFVHFSEKTNLL